MSIHGSNGHLHFTTLMIKANKADGRGGREEGEEEEEEEEEEEDDGKSRLDNQRV